MIQLVLTLLVGLGVFVALYFLSRRPHAVVHAESLLQGRAALNRLRRGLLPPEILERIFSREDFDYVVLEWAGTIPDLLLRERRKIALCWVNDVRDQILSLRRFHLGCARFYSRLSVRTEIKLALEFLMLLFLCQALRLVFFLRGPYGAPAIVGRAVAASARVCAISEAAMSFSRSGEMNPITDESARTPMLS